MTKAILGLLKLLGEKRWEIKLKEAEELAEARGYQVIGEAIQTKEHPVNATFFGSGKVREIKKKAEQKEADVVIIYNDLTSKQKFNIEKMIERKVIDKYDLILEIFKSHAHDAISNLQIKLAKISRQIPYVRYTTTKIHQGEHPYTRAGGEVPWKRKISELRRRKRKIEEKLEKRQREKLRRIESRKEMQFIQGCLVGYYNAGKTSIFNSLSVAEKYTSQKPFTTVQGKVSKLEDKILLVDTIGFVKDIDPQIISSFKINMKDIKLSHFLILTVDSSLSLPLLNNRTKATVEILKDLEVWDNVKLILANKVDLLQEPSLVDQIGIIKTLTDYKAPVIPCSAKSGEGMEKVEKKIKEVALDIQKPKIKVGRRGE